MSSVLARLAKLFALPTLNVDITQLRWSRIADHMQHGVARHGLFYMTEQTLGFEPKGIDALFGARSVSWELSAVKDVELQPTLRKLRVTVLSGTKRDQFIVSAAAVVFNDLSSWRSQHAGDIGE
jgi:hypothetical protein